MTNLYDVTYLHLILFEYEEWACDAPNLWKVFRFNKTVVFIQYDAEKGKRTMQKWIKIEDSVYKGETEVVFKENALKYW